MAMESGESRAQQRAAAGGTPAIEAEQGAEQQRRAEMEDRNR
jgi:hypothetical protein